MSKHPRQWKIESKGGNVATLSFDNISDGWEHYVMLSGDRHHDNSHTCHKLERKYLDKARERDAPIIDAGDIFCGMQSKSDKRQSKSALRPEDSRDDYINALVENATKFYQPYADLFGVVAYGNHDTALIKHYGADVIKLMVQGLNYGLSESGEKHRVFPGGYGGWVKLSFTIRKTIKQSMNLKYFHGSGGGGAVTRGVIDTSRQAVYLPDADIVVNAHVHEGYHVGIARERFTRRGEISRDVVDYVRVPTIKEEYRDGSGGWHVETGKPPKPLGCAWLHLKLEGDKIVKRIILDME